MVLVHKHDTTCGCWLAVAVRKTSRLPLLFPRVFIQKTFYNSLGSFTEAAIVQIGCKGALCNTQSSVPEHLK